MKLKGLSRRRGPFFIAIDPTRGAVGAASRIATRADNRNYGGERTALSSRSPFPLPRQMTTPIAESVEAPSEAKPASRWEDFIDIFYTPSTVYERRKNQSPWPTLWIVTILLFVVTFLTFNAMSPVVENELREQAVKTMAKT